MTAKRMLLCVGLVTIVARSFFGCTPAGPPPLQVPPADSLSTSASTQASDRSALSYGMITSRVKKGVTTQSKLIELFGGPNIATTDSDGTETWVYDRTTSETETTHKKSKKIVAQSKVSKFGVFFGIGVAGTESGKTDVNVETDGQTRVIHSIRSITVVIKFNPDKTVKDYSVRSSSF